MNLLKSMRGQWRLAPLLEIAIGVAILLAIGLGVVLALSGCGPARAPVTTGASQCTPNASRCSPGADSRPQICSPSFRWQQTASEPCAEGTQCCLAAPDEGTPIHACVPAGACVDESLAPAAGAPSEPARDPFTGEDAGQ